MNSKHRQTGGSIRTLRLFLTLKLSADSRDSSVSATSKKQGRGKTSAVTQISWRQSPLQASPTLSQHVLVQQKGPGGPETHRMMSQWHQSEV